MNVLQYVSHRSPQKESKVIQVNSTPHSGLRIPAQLAKYLRLEDLTVLQTLGMAPDQCAALATACKRQENSHWVSAGALRILDLNRSAGEVDVRFVEGVSATGSFPHGVIWGVNSPVVDNPRTVPTDFVRLLSGKIALPDFIEIMQVHAAYKDMIRRLIAQGTEANLPVVIKECHSFPRNFPGRMPPESEWADAYYLGPSLPVGRFQERKMPDIIIVDGGHTVMQTGEQVPGRFCARAVSEIYFEVLTDAGFIVQRGPQGSKITGADNGATVEFGNVSNGVSVIGVEIVSSVLEPKRAEGAGIRLEKDGHDTVAVLDEAWHTGEGQNVLLRLQNAFLTIESRIAALSKEAFYH